MKNIIKTLVAILAISLSFLLVSCDGQKGTSAHNHNGTESHIHTIETSNDAQQNYFGDYSLSDKNFGTKTNVIVTDSERTMVTNSLPNHETGEFPTQGNPNTISAQNKTYIFPVTPKYIGKSQWVRQPGVAINGVKF